MKTVVNQILFLLLLVALVGCGSPGGDSGGGSSNNVNQTDNSSNTAKASCSLSGIEIEHSESRTFYQKATELNGKYCLSESRTCDDGVLSGSYNYSSCTSLPEETITFKIPDTGLGDDLIENPIQFRSNGDGTVTDLNTGLMWRTTSLSSSKTKSAAIEYCNELDYAQYNDWRLPRIDELVITVDFSTETGFSTDYFSSMYNRKLWSNTYLTTDNRAWVFNTYNKETELVHFLENTPHTLCVRGKKVGDFDLAMIDAESVSLVGTNLIADTNISANPSGNYISAISLVCDLIETSGFTDWRLPTIKEMTLLTFAGNQLLDTNFFESTASALYPTEDAHYVSSTNTTEFGKKFYCQTNNLSNTTDVATITSCSKTDSYLFGICVRLSE
jgi:hypothetical protein